MKRFLCVILVFTLFIACSVRPAYAVDVGTVSVALEAFISAALIGLGLSPQAGNNTAFNQIVTNCKEWLQTATIDGLEILSTASGLALSLISPVDGSFYVKKNVIEGIKDWLFDSGTLENVPALSVSESSFVLNNKTYIVTCDSPLYSHGYFLVYKSGKYTYTYGLLYFGSETDFSYKYNNMTFTASSSDSGFYSSAKINLSGTTVDTYRESFISGLPSGVSYTEINADDESAARTAAYNDFLSRLSSPGGGVSFPDGISVSDVVPQVGEDIEITYIDWKELEKQVQEGDGSSENPTDPTNPAPIPLVPYWPIWSPQFSNPDSTLDDVTQSDVWQSGSDPNWNPGNSGENSESSPDIPSLTIDLRKFFPFCIPFDIYDIFVAFAADPVAPHFQWDIDIWNYTWSVDIDLSAWDEVAAILRRLELLAFIVGLGLVTRDKFLRG